jgi:hypothetical protein
MNFKLEPKMATTVGITAFTALVIGIFLICSVSWKILVGMICIYLFRILMEYGIESSVIDQVDE